MENVIKFRLLMVYWMETYDYTLARIQGIEMATLQYPDTIGLYVHFFYVKYEYSSLNSYKYMNKHGRC